jgi:hypothetical protein
MLTRRPTVRRSQPSATDAAMPAAATTICRSLRATAPSASSFSQRAMTARGIHEVAVSAKDAIRRRGSAR